MTTTAEKDAVVANTSRVHPTTLWQQSWIMVKRNMIHTRRMPEMLSDVTIQPIMFVVLFAYVFGASIQTDSASYKEFLLPGIMGQTIVFTAFMTMSIGASLILWDAQLERQDCLANALTLRAQEQCEARYEQAVEERLAELTRRP